MLNTGRKASLVAALAVVSMLGLSSGCRGFFVNPSLSSLAIAPTSATLTQGGTRQMSATGTYSDGTTKDLTGKVDWSSGTPTCAGVNPTTGLVSAAQTVTEICTTTISASLGTVSASTATITVTPGSLLSIALTPSTTTPTHGTTMTF